jgi:beta-phosphoglucomutase
MRNHPDDPWAVIFDMDGVLVDSAPAHFESWQRLARQEGITITREQFDAGFGRQNKDIIPMFFGAVSMQRLAEIAERKEKIYREIVSDRVPAVPGAAALVKNLAARGVSLAVGSAGPRKNIEMVLRAMGIAGDFRAVVSGEDASRGKPDPQVFQMACERLGLPPARCVVIEDALAGVEAAKAAGTAVAAVMMHHPADALRRAGADLVVGTLAELSPAALGALITRR